MFTPRLTPARHGRIDLYFTSDRHTTLNETLTIAQTWLPMLGDEQKILYLSSLQGERELRSEIAKRFTRTPSAQTKRLLAQYLRPDQILGNFDFFEALVRDENVKVVILNCFEFAAITPSRQNKLTAFFKVLKDVYDVHVLVSLLAPSGSTQRGGGKGMLLYIADSITDTGSWLMAKSSEKEFALEAAAEQKKGKNETEISCEFLPEAPLDYRTGIPNYDLPSFMKKQEPPLKINELEAEHDVVWSGKVVVRQ